MKESLKYKLHINTLASGRFWGFRKKKWNTRGFAQGTWLCAGISLVT